MNLRPHYTTPITSIEKHHCETLINLALEEDCPTGDITTQNIFSKNELIKAKIISKEKGIFCGKELVKFITEIDFIKNKSSYDEFSNIKHEPIKYKILCDDGNKISVNQELIILEGDVWALLRLERIILNFLQMLCGISTYVRSLVEIAGENIFILDTRKTIPGYRHLSKYAVYIGGGTNHRINLSDMILVKDNHIEACNGSITLAVSKIKEKFIENSLENSHEFSLENTLENTLENRLYTNIDKNLNKKKIEVEVDNLEQFDEALGLDLDYIMLDNMNNFDILRAIDKFNIFKKNKDIKKEKDNTSNKDKDNTSNKEKNLILEISGGWDKERLANFSKMNNQKNIGISLGSLTHRINFLDLSMEFSKI